jgi:hypothetical protein
MNTTTNTTDFVDFGIRCCSSPSIDTENIESLPSCTGGGGRLLTSTCKIKRVCLKIKDHVESTIKISIWDTYSFWIEATIFITSIIGAILIAYGIMKGFLLWLISTTISIAYFMVNKQYILSVQQIVFLITTVLGIINHFDNIF